MSEAKIKTMGIRISPQMFKTLEKLARKEQTTVSAMVRRLIWKKLGVKDE